MKIKINNGRIIGIGGQELNPVLPTSDLSFIEDKDLYKEIRNYIKSDHKNLNNKLEFNNQVMKHSNSYLAVAVDMFCKQNIPNYRLATQSDLEQNLEFTKGTYNDTGLALRNLTNTNSEKVNHLFKQLKQRGIKLKDFPIWINLQGLELDKDLNFNLTEESFYQTAEQLNWESSTNYSKVNNVGLPKEKDTNGNRNIWTSDHALSRCYLTSSSNLDSGNSDLANSNGSGRVVLAKLQSS